MNQWQKMKTNVLIHNHSMTTSRYDMILDLLDRWEKLHVHVQSISVVTIAALCV